MGIKSVPLQNAISKTLDATLAAAATTLTLNDDVSSLFSGVSATNPGVCVIDRVDSSGNSTPSKREYVTFTGVSTTTLTGLGRNADSSGSDQEHSVGAIVEFVPDVLWADSVKTAYEAVLDIGAGIIIDGGGVELSTGVAGYIEVPFAGTITAVRLLGDQSGSVVVDIWKDTYANYPPTDADSITASAVPTISTATKSEDTTLTGWTTAVTAGDILGFNVDSVTDITRVTVSLTIERS